MRHRTALEPARAAQDADAQVRELAAMLQGETDPQSLPLDRLLLAYRAELLRRASINKITPKHAIDTYRSASGAVAMLGAQRVGDLTKNAVEAHVASRGAARSHRTANGDLLGLRGMLDFAVASGLIESSPLTAVKKLPSGASYRVDEKRPFTEDEALALLGAYQREDARCAESRPRIPQAGLIYAALTTGARFEELTRLRWSGLRPQAGTLVIYARDSKTRRERRVPLSKPDFEVYTQLYEIQSEFLARRPEGADPILLSPTGRRLTMSPASKRMRANGDLAGIEHVDDRGRGYGWRSCRKFVAVTMLERGVPIATVAKVLGHSADVLREWYYEVSAGGLSEARASMPELLEREGLAEVPSWSVGSGGADPDAEAAQMSGGTPHRIRTCNLLIRSRPSVDWGSDGGAGGVDLHGWGALGEGLVGNPASDALHGAATANPTLRLNTDQEAADLIQTIEGVRDQLRRGRSVVIRLRRRVGQ